jgi:hypothetical protein
MLKAWVRVFVSGVMVAVVFAAAPLADHSWGNYHWARTSNPFTLQTGDNLDSKWDVVREIPARDAVTPGPGFRP